MLGLQHRRDVMIVTNIKKQNFIPKNAQGMK